MSGPEPLIAIQVGDLQFTARLERAGAPATCDAFLRLLPLAGPLLQARWSGESAWFPLGDLELGIGPERATTRPEPGQLLLYPKAVSETEILFPYGLTAFGSKFGPLAGNHFATIVSGIELFPELGRRVVWEGAQQTKFDRGR